MWGRMKNERYNDNEYNQQRKRRVRTDVTRDKRRHDLQHQRSEFPDGLRKICKGAFEHCTKLKSVDLSNTSLKLIGKDAFKNCSSLKLVNFPDGLERIGKGAFENCASFIQYYKAGQQLLHKSVEGKG